MMFGQLSGRDSLRDLLVCISGNQSKHYHLGFGKSISRCNLAEANERSDSRIFELFAYEMIAEARKCCIADSDFSLSIKGNVYAFDSTVIDMCLNVFWWGTFRRAKAAVNLHTLFDVKTSIPVFVHVIPAIVHDVNGLDHLAYGAGGYYIMDRGHVDFARFHVIDQHHAFFVTRAKNNSQLTRISSAKPDKAKGIMCDQHVILKGHYSYQSYPKVLRRIKFFDAEQIEPLCFYQTI